MVHDRLWHHDGSIPQRAYTEAEVQVLGIGEEIGVENVSKLFDERPADNDTDPVQEEGIDGPLSVGQALVVHVA